MPSNTRKTIERINQVVGAWEGLRPDKSFGGLTLKQFKAGVQASLDVRAELQKAESHLIALQNKRAEADAASSQLIQRVVNNVKGDLAEGDDGDLYDAMGYVRRSERKSGLKRPDKAPQQTGFAA